jgi:uncharacterized protein (TIGR03790 family)
MRRRSSNNQGKAMKILSVYSSILMACLCLTASVSAQQSYTDVLVVINSNSAVSEQIGSYFAAQRNIPASNVVRIAVPVSEEINDIQFRDLRTQLETIMLARGLKDAINYIVTTKGMPLKINRGDPWYNASVESELMLILGKYAAYIGGYNRIFSPYYGVHANFSHAVYDIYLVTRLDGYTVSDVYGMIDRSASIPSGIPAGAAFVMDQDTSWNSAAGYLNTNMVTATTALQGRNLSVTLDQTTLYLTHQTNVIGYVSWGSNDHYAAAVTDHGKQYNTYLPGAIGETYVSTSGRSFTAPMAYGQSAIADMIAEGITGVKGYVYEPYSSSMADVSILFPMYADGYSLAESFFSASSYLSWMDVVVGDPKYRVVNTRIASASNSGDSTNSSNPLPVELASLRATTAGASVSIAWTTATEINNFGFDVERQYPNGLWKKIGFVQGTGSSNLVHAYTYNDKMPMPGAILYRLKQIDRDGSFSYSKEISAVVSRPGRQPAELLGNYPNPFNPQTMIKFRLYVRGKVSLKIFNTLGQEVASLINDELSEGEYEVPFNGAQLASGVYLTALSTGGSVSIHKLLLTK